jgi:hypothetical protein
MIRPLLLQEHSKKQTMKIIRFIGSSTSRQKELMELVLKNEHIISQRASWVMSCLAAAEPAVITPYYSRLLKLLRTPCHNAIRRNILGAFQSAPIPVKYESQILEQCFSMLNDSSEFIAIKAGCLTILGRLVNKYPELMPEFESSIQLQWENSSAGFKARVRKIRKTWKN